MTRQKQNKVGDIVKFKDASIADAGVFLIDFLYNKRLDTWDDRNILKDQIGIFLEVRSFQNTFKSEYQKYYRKKDWIPYHWYCFKTLKTYLIYQCEIE